MKIIVHGFQDIEWTEEEFKQFLFSPSALIGAEQDCNITVDGETKTAKEWRNDRKMYATLKDNMYIDTLIESLQDIRERNGNIRVVNLSEGDYSEGLFLEVVATKTLNKKWIDLWEIVEDKVLFLNLDGTE